jgi:hypothetical protein
VAKDLRVVQVDPVTREVSLALPIVPTYLSGVDLLIQTVALYYLSNPGQDLNDFGGGSGVRDIIGQIDIIGEDQLKADFLARTAKIENEIVNIQSELNIQSSERLKTLIVQGMQIDAATLEMKARVKIENQANESRVVTV